MKILHTSDWHLGRTLYGRKRHEEFDAFLDWLAATVAAQQVEALLIAGDVFDTSTPGNRAQAQYYRFLHRIAALPGCRHVVVVAGNHDSPTFLDAPAALLAALDVHVIGQARANPADEVLLLRNAQGQPGLLVCAVPYLRSSDLRSAEAGESLHEKEQKLREGLRAHYAAVAEHALAQRAALLAQGGPPVPIVAMGHLFAEGGSVQAREGEGVRDLYVGSLGRVDASVFSPAFDYVALGHLHVPQSVGGVRTIRYSGSPLPMGFGEAGQAKSVCLVQWAAPALPSSHADVPVHAPASSAESAAGGLSASVTENATAPERIELLPVPVFQPLERVGGDWPAIASRLAQLAQADAEVLASAASAGVAGEANALPGAWLEVVYEGADLMPDLRARLDEAVAGTRLQVLRVKNTRLSAQALAHSAQALALEPQELDAREVFERCLEAHAIVDGQRQPLRQAHEEILHALQEEDGRADA